MEKIDIEKQRKDFLRMMNETLDTDMPDAYITDDVPFEIVDPRIHITTDEGKEIMRKAALRKDSE